MIVWQHAQHPDRISMVDTNIKDLLLQQSLLDQALAPSTTHELIEKLASWETTGWVWRGQSRAWKLHSGAVRVSRQARTKPWLNSRVPLEHLVAAHEDALLCEARTRGHIKPDVPDLAALAILQHHGAATRYLDATTNMLVAAWFATRSDPEEDGLLMLLPRGKEIDGNELRAGIHELRASNELRSFRPPVSLLRAVAQHSVLLFGKTSENDDCSLPVPFDISHAIRVSPELKKSLRKSFHTVFRLDEAAMFPDLLGFCLENSVQGGWLAGAAFQNLKSLMDADPGST
jgi:hypothetical protein